MDCRCPMCKGLAECGSYIFAAETVLKYHEADLDMACGKAAEDDAGVLRAEVDLNLHRWEGLTCSESVETGLVKLAADVGRHRGSDGRWQVYGRQELEDVCTELAGEVSRRFQRWPDADRDDAVSDVFVKALHSVSFPRGLADPPVRWFMMIAKSIEADMRRAKAKASNRESLTDPAKLVLISPHTHADHRSPVDEVITYRYFDELLSVFLSRAGLPGRQPLDDFLPGSDAWSAFCADLKSHTVRGGRRGTSKCEAFALGAMAVVAATRNDADGGIRHKALMRELEDALGIKTRSDVWLKRGAKLLGAKHMGADKNASKS